MAKANNCSCSIQTQLHFGDNFDPWIVEFKNMKPMKVY